MGKYLEVIVPGKKPYCAGQVQHQPGTTYYGEDAITEGQVKSILANKAGKIIARIVDAPSEGAKVIEAPKPAAKAGKAPKE